MKPLLSLNVALLLCLMVLGTIMPQGQPAAHYEAASPQLAPLILALGLHHIYSSALFLALLATLAFLVLLNAVRLGVQAWQGSAQAGSALMAGGASCLILGLFLSAHPRFSGERLLELRPGQSLDLSAATSQDNCTLFPEAELSLQDVRVELTPQRQLKNCRSRWRICERKDDSKQCNYNQQSNYDQQSNHNLQSNYELQRNHELQSSYSELECSINRPARWRSLSLYQSGWRISSFEIRWQDEHSDHLTNGQAQGSPESAFPGNRTKRQEAIKSAGSTVLQAIEVPLEVSPNARVFTVPGHPNRYLIHRFLPHAVWKNGTLTAHDDKPGQAAALVMEIPENGQPPHSLGWITARHSVTTGDGCILSLGKLQISSTVCIKRDSGRIWAATGTLLLIAGWMLVIGRNTKKLWRQPWK